MSAIAAAVALCAALAVAVARLGFFAAADVLAVAAALGGVGAFVYAGIWTLRRARRLPSRPRQP